MPLPSSREKSNKRRLGSDTDSTSTSASTEVIVEANSSSDKKLCIVCGNPASSNIVKDAHYEAVMQIYWCTLAVDVKPGHCRKTDTCGKCFDRLVTYFETNDIIVYFENYFKLQRLRLLRTTLSGIKKWDEEGHTLTKIQQDVRKFAEDQQGSPFAEEEQYQQALKGYDMDPIQMLDDDEDDKTSESAGKSRKVLRLSKAEPVTKKKVLSLKGTPRKGTDSNDEYSD